MCLEFGASSSPCWPIIVLITERPRQEQACQVQVSQAHQIGVLRAIHCTYPALQGTIMQHSCHDLASWKMLPCMCHFCEDQNP